MKKEEQEEKGHAPSTSTFGKARSEAPPASRTRRYLFRSPVSLMKNSWQAGRQVCEFTKDFFLNLNFYSAVSVILTFSAMLTVWFAHPSGSQVPTILRMIAAMLGLSAAFMSNTALSRHSRSPDQVADDKRVALHLSCLGAVLVFVSYVL